jgi:Putative auto-transporter adhesin, head GIN domain
MSKNAFLGVATVAALLLSGCTFYVPQPLPQTIVGSGKSATVEKDLTGFSKIAASSAFQLDVSQSDGYSVALTVDEKVVPYLDVTVQGDTLRIALKPGLSMAGATGPLKAKVTMPKLTGLNLSGATRATVAGFKSTERLDTEVSGASRLDGSLEAGDVSFQLSGASRVTLTGKGQKMALEASGASQGNLEQFVVTDANVELSGASRATVNATGKLDVNVSGASTLRYTGSPTMGSVQSSGASTIQPK